MTNVISLSEKAYETLKGMKKSGESFSDVVLRVASKERKRSILEFAGTWKGGSVVGLVSVADASKEGVAEAVADMRSVGVKNVVMLNGDNSADLRPYRLRGEASRI